MKIILKSRREIEHMRKAGNAAGRIVRAMCDACQPGVTTAEVGDICERMLEECGGRGLSKNYPTYEPGKGFPASSCISVNEEVVHGIPSKRRKLRNGDIVTCDLAMILDGYCADHAWTVGVGDIGEEAARLLDDGKRTLRLALERMRPDVKWSSVAGEMETFAKDLGYGVVQEFVGHGIGRSMHEDPKVPNFVNTEQLRDDFRLRPGLTIAVEPMLICGGNRNVEQPNGDGWTVTSESRRLTCHFEHTVAVTANGVDVLTDGSDPWGI